MKVNEMLVVLGGKDLILRRAEELPEDVIQVRNPLDFLARIENLEPQPSSAPKRNGKAPAPVHKRKTRVRHRPPDHEIIHSERSGHNGPRLGYHLMTPDELETLAQAIHAKDAALSELQRNCLRLRFGLEGSKSHTLKQILASMSPAVLNTHVVRQEIRRGLRALGLKARSVHRRNR